MISDAIEGWNQKLYEVSVPVLSNEPKDSTHSVAPFDPNRESFKAANAELTDLRNLFVNSNGINLYTIITGFILILMLLFPYFLQKRNTRATGLYSLIPISKIVNVKKHVRKIDVEERNFDNTDFSQNQACDDIYGGTF